MSKLWWIIIALVIVGGGAWLYTKNKSETTVPQTPVIEEQKEATTEETPKEEVMEGTTVVEISYTDTGFEPATVEIEVGDTVRFVNKSSRMMWVASAIHPTHVLLPGFDQLEGVDVGGRYSFTFDKVGEWKYHNHLSPTMTGTVVVTEKTDTTTETM